MQHDRIPGPQDSKSLQNITSSFSFQQQHGPSTIINLPPPAPTRGHQRSRTTADLPPLFSRTPSASPTRSSTFLPFFKSTTGRARSKSPEKKFEIENAAEFSVESVRLESQEEPVKKSKPTGAVEKLASWFEGSSDPVNITLIPSPQKELKEPFPQVENMEKSATKSVEPRDGFTQKPQKKGLSGPPNYQPRLGFFRRASQQQQSKAAPIEQDDLVQLDIRETLFPVGLPDEYSPAAFKNLQLNAEGTLRRFQNAHFEQRKTIHTLSSTKNIQSDELEAAQTRSEHLRLQLQDMAQKVAEQAETITVLKAELDESHNLSRTSDQKTRSIRMVPQESGLSHHDLNSTPHRRFRRPRSSDISLSTESEADSELGSAQSVFSDNMSAIDSPATSIATSPVMRYSTMQYTPVKHQVSSTDHQAVIPILECQKCHGVDPIEAWDVINMMKMESKVLKDRITELEGAQVDALDLLSGLKLS